MVRRRELKNMGSKQKREAGKVANEQSQIIVFFKFINDPLNNFGIQLTFSEYPRQIGSLKI